MNKADARDQLLMQVVREADRAAAQIPVCRMCGKPSPNGDPCEPCSVKVESMNKSEIAEDFAKILSPAIDCRAPYAKVMIEKLVERAIAESQAPPKIVHLDCLKCGYYFEGWIDPPEFCPNDGTNLKRTVLRVGDVEPSWSCVGCSLKFADEDSAQSHAAETGHAYQGEAKPTLDELLEAARHHVMTDEEKEAQRQSWVRGEMALSESERGMTARFPPNDSNSINFTRHEAKEFARKLESGAAREVSPPATCKSCGTILYRTLGEKGEYCDRCESGAAQGVSPSANFVSEIRPRPDDPSCHVCGAQMVPREWTRLSCATTTGIESYVLCTGCGARVKQEIWADHQKECSTAGVEEVSPPKILKPKFVNDIGMLLHVLREAPLLQDVMRPGDARCPQCENEDYVDRLIERANRLEKEIAALREKP